MRKNVLITGGAKGIGAEIATVFAENGDNVVFSYNNSVSEAQALVKKLSLLSKNVFAFKADVSKAEEVDKLFAFAEEKIGKIEVLVNNAGIALYSLFQETSEKEWDSVLNTNLKGVYLCSKRAVNSMINAKSGKIVNVSSVWGKVGASLETAYSASKAGIIGLTKALAKELGPSNINVNAVCPGVILTDMVKSLGDETVESLKELNAMGRLGTPRDVAELIYFLSSSKASYISGEAISVDGCLL